MLDKTKLKVGDFLICRRTSGKEDACFINCTVGKSYKVIDTNWNHNGGIKLETDSGSDIIWNRLAWFDLVKEEPIYYHWGIEDIKVNFHSITEVEALENKIKYLEHKLELLTRHNDNQRNTIAILRKKISNAVKILNAVS